MRNLSLLPLAALASPAAAQTAPPAPVTVSGGATLVSDYRFRGLSQTDRDPAVQANVTIDTLAGAYGSVWASTIGGYVARGADAEVDLTTGYRKAIGGTTLDGGLVYYVYPGHGAGDTNVAEPFLNASRSYGPLTAKVGANLAWKQRALGLSGDRRGGAYVYGELAAGVPRTPVSVTAHVGRSLAANAITFGRRYTDWSLGGSYALHAFTLGVSYVDNDARDPVFPRAATRGPADAASRTVVGSVGVAF